MTWLVFFCRRNANIDRQFVLFNCVEQFFYAHLANTIANTLVKQQMWSLLLTLMQFVERSLWDEIPEGLRFLFGIAAFLLPLIVLTIVLYFAGLIVVGGRRARLGDAFLIALLGTVIGIVCALFIPSFLLLLIVQIIVWLALIKHFYETGWLGALAVSILSVVVFIVILFILALVFAISFILFEKLFLLLMFSLL